MKLSCSLANHILNKSKVSEFPCCTSPMFYMWVYKWRAQIDSVCLSYLCFMAVLKTSLKGINAKNIALTKIQIEQEF